MQHRPMKLILRLACFALVVVFFSGCASSAPELSPGLVAAVTGPAPPGRGVPLNSAVVERLRSRPDHPQTYLDLGRELRRTGRLDLSEEAFRAADALARRQGLPRATGLFDLAVTLHLAGQPEEAQNLWRRVTELPGAPEDLRGRAHTRLAVAAAFRGDLPAARSHRDQARTFGVTPPVALGRLLDPPGDHGAAASPVRPATADDFTLGPAVVLDPDPELQAVEFSVTAALPFEGAPDGTAEILVSWIDNHPPPPRETVNFWRLAYGSSTDGAASWFRGVLRRPNPPPDEPFTFEGDPMTARDPRTGRFFLGGIGFFSNPGPYVASKVAGASSFEDPVFPFQASSDKGFLAAGAPPGRPGITRLYLTYLTTVAGFALQTSDDLGKTWAPLLAVPVDSIGHLPRIGPQGELYIASWDTEDGVILFRSFDGGETVEGPITVARRMDFWTTQDGSRVAGDFRLASLTSLAVDPISGDLFVVWYDTSRTLPTDDGPADRDLDLYISRSSDRGETWTPARLVHGAPVAGDQFIPWIEADDAGRLHLLWYDTREEPRPDTAGSALVEAWYALSTDGGQTWAEAPVSEAPFESAFADAYRSVTGFQFLGDYLGLDVAGDRAYLGFTTTAAGNADPVVRTIRLGGDAPEICVRDTTTLCFLNGRFRVRVAWNDTRNGGSGVGRVQPLGAAAAESSGAFYFFNPSNLELVVKVLDGRVVNGFFWVFTAPLTDVEHTVTVEDLETGDVRVYFCAGGDVCPQTDVQAF